MHERPNQKTRPFTEIARGALAISSTTRSLAGARASFGCLLFAFVHVFF